MQQSLLAWRSPSGLGALPKVLGRFLAGSGSKHELRQQLDLYMEVREKWVPLDKLFFTQNSIAPYFSKGAHYGRLLEETIQELHANHAANDMRLLMEEAFSKFILMKTFLN